MFLQNICITDMKQQNIFSLQALTDKDNDEATAEEEDEDIEAILAEEFLEEEEEEEPEEEENEEEAVERMQNEISERFELDLEGLQSVQVLIPLLILLKYMIT